MHFLGEAWYRRPLEPRSLAYSRGSTAIFMGLTFLAFCGYLINQICTDKPLLRNSLEEIGNSTTTPDIEMCVQNTTMQIVGCSVMYYNWSSAEIPDCWSRYFRPGNNEDSSTKCWYFETNNTYHMATGMTYDNRDALRRIDFYWHIDSLANLSYASVSVPAIALQLYDPRFTTWRTNTLGDTQYEKETAINIQLGASRATSYYNHTSITYYSQHKYRAIKPRDFGAILGIKPAYSDVMTLPNNQHHWPLQDNPLGMPVPRNLYHGLFSIQLSKSTVDVETEVRQHTILNAVALAGGCYGVLTSIYIFLFGMSRLTPWGLVHHIPTYISRKKHDADSNLYINEEEMIRRNDPTDDNLMKRKSSLLVPWFFRTSLTGDKTYNAEDKSDAFIRKMVDKTKLDTEENLHELKSIDQITRIDSKSPLYSAEANLLNSSHNDSFSGTHLDAELLTDRPQLKSMSASNADSSRTIQAFSMDTSNNYTDMQAIIQMLRHEQQKSNNLSNRVEELEAILSQYFINTYYLDQIRSREKAERSRDSIDHPNVITRKISRQ
ncbi:hypothetical protein BD560DRAFT_414152 [Blakeslea trispora]|nr:hypothetical protein BD560DRAFT_414152 [Blakeslea trispora]